MPTLKTHKLPLLGSNLADLLTLTSAYSMSPGSASEPCVRTYDHLQLLMRFHCSNQQAWQAIHNTLNSFYAYAWVRTSELCGSRGSM